MAVIQFVNKDNISFLRVHKPSKYGDDLTNVRADFKYVNKTKKSIRGIGVINCPLSILENSFANL